MLRAHLEHPLVLPFGADEILPFLDGERERLFGIHVEPRLHGLNADEHSGMGGRGHKHPVELLLGEHLLIVLIAGAVFRDNRVGKLLRHRQEGGDLPPIAVGHRHEFQIRRTLLDQIAGRPPVPISPTRIFSLAPGWPGLPRT